jgi:hypothetical protein
VVVPNEHLAARGEQLELGRTRRLDVRLVGSEAVREVKYSGTKTLEQVEHVGDRARSRLVVVSERPDVVRPRRVLDQPPDVADGTQVLLLDVEAKVERRKLTLELANHLRGVIGGCIVRDEDGDVRSRRARARARTDLGRDSTEQLLEPSRPSIRRDQNRQRR